jgi:DNA replication protein DnaC
MRGCSCHGQRDELLFDVVSRAYERTSLIVTTNLPFEQWTEVLGSERLTGALLAEISRM